jgi:SPP1 gp7 family putative phage head morphogenesis protein
MLEILDNSNIQIRDVIKRAKSVETKAQYRMIAAEIHRITNELRRQLNGQLELDFRELAKAETRFVENAAHKVGVTTDFVLPAPAKIWAAASFGSYTAAVSQMYPNRKQVNETFESYLNGLSDNLFKVWDTNVRGGYLAGLTAQHINRAVLGSVQNNDPGQMQALRKSLETNTRTMIAHLTETARDSVYKANSGLFSRYRYVGTLDSRTCLVCGELDGKVFETLEDAPQLPAHHNCRCLYLPEIKGMEGFDDDDTRASVDGPVKAGMTYEEWLKTQPDDVVSDILGPTRFALYKSGMPVTSFVASGETLTLKQLAEKEGIDLTNTRENVRSSVNSSIISDDQVNNLAIYQELDRLRELGRESGVERLSILNYDGTSLGSWKGTKDSISITETIKRKLLNAPDNTLICLHNHPKSSSFSLADLDVMCSYNSIKELRVIGHNGMVYTMVAGNGQRVSAKELEKYENSIYSQIRQNIAYKATRGIRTTYFSERNRLFADHFGWSYKEEKPNGRK